MFHETTAVRKRNMAEYLNAQILSLFDTASNSEATQENSFFEIVSRHDERNIYARQKMEGEVITKSQSPGGC